MGNENFCNNRQIYACQDFGRVDAIFLDSLGTSRRGFFVAHSQGRWAECNNDKLIRESEVLYFPPKQDPKIISDVTVDRDEVGMLKLRGASQRMTIRLLNTRNRMTPTS
jgi:hypothetical protein